MPVLGLIFKFGEPHENDKKYLGELTQIKGMEDLTIKIVDWRFKPDNEQLFFQSMPAGHINYCANDFYNQQREKYLASLAPEIKDTYKDYKNNTAIKDQLEKAVKEYYKLHNKKDIDEDAKEYYRYTTGKSLNETVDEYFASCKLNAIYLPGANFDPKDEYCQNDRLKVPPDIRKEEFERQLIKRAIARGIPVLGVCSGSWLIASCFEGSKTQALKDDALETHKEGPVQIIDETPINYVRLPSHDIVAKPGTHLHGIIKNAEQWEATPKEEGGVTKVLRKKLADQNQHKNILEKRSSTNENNYVRLSANSTHWRVIVPKMSDDEKNKFMTMLQQTVNDEEKYNRMMNLKIDDNNELMISALDPKHLTIEAIETRFGAPVMGVQFHLEYRVPMLVTKNKIMFDVDYAANRRILEALADAAKTHARKTRTVEALHLKFFKSKKTVNETINDVSDQALTNPQKPAVFNQT